MITYYSAVILLIIMAMAALGILVHENGRIQRAHKQMYYLSYLLIALSALAEWAGVQLDGRENLPHWPLIAAKCADYILSPMAGGALVRQMKLRNRWDTVLQIVLAVNMVFQFLACPMGWTVRIDANGHYSHGPLYFVYICVYITVIVLTALQFLLYGKTFSRQNRVSLYASFALILCGVGIQEVFGSGFRTAYIGITLGAAMLFIHDAEFSQISADKHIEEQWIQITTDALTGMQSRYAYEAALRNYDRERKLPKDLVVFSIDVNGLKGVNDTLGHAAGDELIRAAARCIENVFGSMGRCCRTGGDEFVVLAHMDRAQTDAALERLQRDAKSWSGEMVKELAMAAGCALAAEHPGLTAAKLVIEADKEMYAAKSRYYRESGKDRRSR